MKKFYYILFLLIPTLAFVGCTDENFYEDSSSESPMGKLSYRISLDDEMESRAIGDGLSVNTLKVGIFQDETLISEKEIKRGEDGKFMVNDITLLKNLEYQIVFWAYVKNNGIYQINEDFNLTIDYNKYDEVSLKGTEIFDAFYKLEKVTLTGNDQNIDIELIRPFAQLNIAAKEQDVFDKVKKSSFTIDKVYTKLNLRTGETESEESVNLSFIYSDDDINENQSIQIAEEYYYYVASAYLLAPQSETIKLTGGLYGDNEESINNFDFEAVPLKANHRTNIFGEMIQVEELAPWSGVFTVPTDDGLTCGVTVEDANNVLHIDTPEELAYCMQNGYPDGYDAIHICANHNMKNNDYTWVTIQNVPQGVIVDGTSADGILSHSISNVNMSGAVTGIFGDAQGLKVRNLQLKNITLNSTSSTAAGILAGTVKGTSSFENVIIENCNVYSGSDAGGMIGYIARKEEKKRAESLDVTFNNCQVNKTNIQSNGSEGLFVGKFSGYDNQERLSFDANCKAENTDITNYTSSYNTVNQSAWLEEVDSKYDAWLGTETYRRGVVKFEDKRLVPKWDGTTTVEPLLADPTYDSDVTAGNNRFVIYSPYDLAGARNKTASPTAIYLRADVDMNGQGADGEYNVPSNFTQSAYTSTDDNVFNPFSYVTTLDGYKDEDENYSIYNLSIAQIEQERAAFILYASGTTTHKNINFRNCQTVAVHKPVQTDAKAYGAILVSNVDATYTMENVHAYDCKVFALQKVGTLGARISGTSTLTNNSVNNCYVENYECKISERFSSGEKTIGSWKVTVYADFYPYGEVGGMYGFIQGNSTLTGCKVNGTTIYAFGQDDKMATTSGSLLARLGIAALGYYKVPGRHVSTLIGNIRATGTVTMTGCTVDANTKCTKRHDKHNSTYNYIGQAYIVKFVDSEGSVTVDNKKLTLADCNKNTKL